MRTCPGTQGLGKDGLPRDRGGGAEHRCPARPEGPMEGQRPCPQGRFQKTLVGVRALQCIHAFMGRIREPSPKPVGRPGGPAVKASPQSGPFSIPLDLKGGHSIQFNPGTFFFYHLS